jgi:hypothetical protein
MGGCGVRDGRLTARETEEVEMCFFLFLPLSINKNLGNS